MNKYTLENVYAVTTKYRMPEVIEKARETKTQIVIGDYRYNKDSGLLRGDTGNGYSCTPKLLTFDEYVTHMRPFIDKAKEETHKKRQDFLAQRQKAQNLCKLIGEDFHD